MRSQKHVAEGSVGKSCVRPRAGLLEGLETRRLFATIVVNTTIDATFPAGSQFVSLRNALATASAAGAGQTTNITFDSSVFNSAKTITLNGTQLELGGSGSTTITAPSGGVTLDAAGKSRVMQIDNGAKASLSNLTLTGGNTNGPAGLYSQGTVDLTNVTVTKNVSTYVIGGIQNQGTMTLSNVRVTDNTAQNGIGGIDNDDSATMTLTNVTVSGNSVAAGGVGGVLNGDNGTMTWTGGTISGNTATGGDGGGIKNGSQDLNFSTGSMTLTNVTVANNTSTGNGGGIDQIQQFGGNNLTLTNVTVAGNKAANGGGVYQGGSFVPLVANTLIAGNSLTTNGTGPDVAGNFNSLGYNLVGKTDGSTGFNAADLTGTAAKPLGAKLGTLADNGGPTQTLLPQAGSAAIDHGFNGYVPDGVTTDQRGDARIVNGTVDIGAVETTAAVVTAKITETAPSAQTATAGVSKAFNLGSFAATNATAPYTVTVNWGDGSAPTTFTQSSTGTIAVQPHTYAKSGTDTISVTVTDSAGHASNTATSAVTVSGANSNTASIAGTVFKDANGNGKQDSGETGLSGVALYNDANNNSKQDSGEATATTLADGTYSFTGLAAGSYKIRQVLPGGYSQTLPTNNYGITLTLKAGQGSTGNLFGDKPIASSTGSISGTVFGDSNANGKYDSNEFGLGLWTVFLDTNKDGKLSTGETSVTTDADGLFGFTGLAAGTYTVRVVQRTGSTASTAASLSITLTSGQAKTGQLFGEKKSA